MRITQKQVENMFERIEPVLPKRPAHHWVLDNYAPPGNKYRWTLCLTEDRTGAQHTLFNERMSNEEMRAFFMGWWACLDTIPFKASHNNPYLADIQMERER